MLKLVVRKMAARLYKVKKWRRKLNTRTTKIEKGRVGMNEKESKEWRRK
jgi:hypothetical protein